ncbi:MAG: hypothetical protein II117_01810 [Clostridia bacterium]|nr:hypothetical protein [Clostridia bacterium]
MAYQNATLPSFSGVRMDLCEGLMKPDMSPDAYNVDTRTGALALAGGFTRVMPALVEADTPFERMYVYATEHGNRYFAVSQDMLFLYDAGLGIWSPLYQFERGVTGERMDFLKARVGTADRLLIACGTEPMIAFDSETGLIDVFGSEEKLSDRTVSFVELYFGRLFAAGDPRAPSRLYWSKAPGGGRTIDDWRSDASSENVSGGFVDVGVDDDPITGIFALSNQLLIFKRDSLYRLLGDRPSNYRIVSVDAAFRQPIHTACVRYADRLFFLTDGGLCFYDGQTVRRSAAFRALEPLLKTANLNGVRAAACDDTLYFAIRVRYGAPYNDTVIEYDVLRDRYMLRNGFTIVDFCTVHGALHALTGGGKFVTFDGNSTYDGDCINAHWQTPLWDLGRKDTNKTLLRLTVCGTGRIRVRVDADGGSYETSVLLSSVPNSVTEIPLRALGRVFRLRFSNVGGAAFTLDAPVTLLYDSQRRPE